MKYLAFFVCGLAVVMATADPEPQGYYTKGTPGYSKGYTKPASYSPPSYHAPKYPATSYGHHDYKPPAYGHHDYKAPSYGHSDYKAPSYGHSYGPYKKPDYCDPKAPPKCALNSTHLGYCLKDYEYPEYEVQYAIEYDPLVLKKYADVADQSADNTVDGLSAVKESAFDYSNYHGSPFEKGNWVGGEGYICPSEVLYARPVRAANIKGEWRVIVQNVAYYTQTQRVETCLFPGASCRTLAPCYKSQCVQKHVYHRMLSFDPCDPYKGLFIDIYKLPSACSCHIP